MSHKMQNWLVIGIPRNWETALSQPVPVWGLKPRYEVEFQALKTGDLLWFYSTSPVGGIVGIGIVKDKYMDDINLIWEEEQKKKEVIWPLRFRIHVLKALPTKLWRTNKIKVNDFNLFWQLGFQPLRKDHAIELWSRAKNSFGITDTESLFVGSTIIQPLVVREKQAIYTPSIGEELSISHKELQDQIAEIGKLQFYYTETEHLLELPGERKSLDVIWKREIDGAPTYAFEVELSGMLERAIERLKFAFRKWNSQPRIIAPKESMKKLHNIIEVSDKDFLNRIKIYEPAQINSLLNHKRELKTLEQTLDLY